MVLEGGWVDPVRLDRRPLKELLDDGIPEPGNPRWKREMREVNVKRAAKGYDPL